jgi:type II secretory pathway component PulJ
MELVLIALFIGAVLTVATIAFANSSGSNSQHVPVRVKDRTSERALEEINNREQARYMNQMIDRIHSDNKNIRDRQDRH